jgi:hypothetical protein
MALPRQQAHAITGAVWLFGLAALFYTGWWWPGIMFVVGAAMIIEGLVAGKRWYALQGAAWVIGIGVWALLNFQVWFLFVILGVSVLVGAFAPPPMLAKEPRPRYETDLE